MKMQIVLDKVFVRKHTSEFQSQAMHKRPSVRNGEHPFMLPIMHDIDGVAKKI